MGHFLRHAPYAVLLQLCVGTTMGRVDYSGQSTGWLCKSVAGIPGGKPISGEFQPELCVSDCRLLRDSSSGCPHHICRTMEPQRSEAAWNQLAFEGQLYGK